MQHLPSPAPNGKFGDLVGRAGQAAAIDVSAGSEGNVAASPADIAVDFLRTIDPDGWHNLVAIDPHTKQIEGRTFAPGELGAARDWIAARDGTKNLHWSVNEPKAGAPDKKLTKDDIAAIRVVCIDRDPKDNMPAAEGRADALSTVGKLETCPAPPTVTIDSGGGAQAFWILSAKLPAGEYRDWAEAQGRALAALVDGDRVHDVNRIMRLPGTENIPNAAKVAKGRERRRATILKANGPRHSHDVLRERISPIKRAGSAAATTEREADVIGLLDMNEIQSAATLDDLGPLGARFRECLTADPALARLWDGEPLGSGTTGSDYRASLARAMARHGFGPQDYARVAYVWPYAVQPQHEDQRDEKLAARSLARDWIRCGEPYSPDSIAARFFDHEAARQARADVLAEIPDQPSALFDVLSVDDLFKRPDPSYLIDRHLPESSFGFLYGDPGTGKSFVALDWALHIAFGRGDWHGDTIKAPEGAGVIYLAGEGASGFKTRIAAWMARHGVSDPDNARFGLIQQSVSFMAPEDVNRLGRTLARKRPNTCLVVVDTVSRSIPGADENSQKEMTLFTNACETLRQTFNCVVLGVHHTTKSSGAMRGSSVFPGSADFIFKFTRAKGAPVGRLFCEKMKDGPDGWEERYRFDLVAVGERSSLVPLRCQSAAGLSVPMTRELRDRIFADMQAAFDRKEPWGRTYHAGDRQFGQIAFQTYGLEAEKAEELLKLWLSTGDVVEEVADKKSKRKGLRPAEQALASPFE